MLTNARTKYMIYIPIKSILEFSLNTFKHVTRGPKVHTLKRIATLEGCVHGEIRLFTLWNFHIIYSNLKKNHTLVSQFLN